MPMSNPGGGGGGVSTLATLTDVSIKADRGADNNALVFNFATGKWIASQNLASVPNVSAFNPADKSGNIALSNNNFTATIASVGGGVRTNTARQSGKYYLEYNVSTWTSASGGVGFYTATASFSAGTITSGALMYLKTGAVTSNGGFLPSIQTYATGNTIGAAIDFGNNAVWFNVNGGIWNNNAANNPATNTGGLAVGVLTAQTLFAGIFDNNAADVVTINPGSSPFANPAPAGFLPWDIFAPQSQTVGASPVSFTALTTGTFAVNGGTVSAITLTRGTSAAVNLGAQAGSFSVSSGDILTVTYTAAPTVTFIPLAD